MFDRAFIEAGADNWPHGVNVRSEIVNLVDDLRAGRRAQA